jgi:hypothetical protein
VWLEVISVWISVAIDDDTKLRTENRMIGTTSMQVHHRRLRTSGSTELLQDALRLSAVIGFSFAASVESAASKFAAPGKFQSGLVAALALRILVLVASSTSIPVSAACVNNNMASSKTRQKFGVTSASNGAGPGRVVLSD